MKTKISILSAIYFAVMCIGFSSCSNIHEDLEKRIEELEKLHGVTENITPPTGTENGYDYVDLGLSVKWATCNVGSSSPEDYGDYFAWGCDSTNINGSYSWETYKWNVNGIIIKYDTIDNKTILDKEDDAASKQMKGKWRMPTKAEIEELINKCKWEWVTKTGVNGYKVIGNNGNSIFLPAAGYRRNENLYNAGSKGYYWSSTIGSYYTSNASYLFFNSANAYLNGEDRATGRTIRGVCK